MLLEPNSDLEKPARAKTLVISIAVHVVLVAVLLLRPDLLTNPPKRVIRIAGQDYNLDTTELTLLPPPSAATPPPDIAKNQPPLVQPPAPPQLPEAAPPPPPPTPPPAVISPDDVIKDGARPDAAPKASRGDTPEPAKNGGNPDPVDAPKPPQQPKTESGSPAPLTQNTNPNALRLPSVRSGNAIEDAIRQAQIHLPPGGRTGTPGGMEDPNFSTDEPQILSDTKGYDFGPYMNQVVNRVRLNWYSLIPDVARLGKKGKVVIIFTITPSGAITGFRLAANSGTDALDRAAQGAITFSNPFPKLPADFKGDNLVLQFSFLYNMKP